MVGVGHASTTVYATDSEVYTLPSISPVPVSGSIPVAEQLVSASGQGFETPPTVSDHAVLMIVVADYLSFSTCL